MREVGGHRRIDRPRGGLLRTVGALLLGAVVMGSAAAQDTPEMLAAMQAHLPPVPERVPARDALPVALQAEIPAVRIAVHRWHADPALRFVMIQDRRIGEGDVVDRGLWLRRVERDGVVLQFRDAFFFQPR